MRTDPPAGAGLVHEPIRRMAAIATAMALGAVTVISGCTSERPETDFVGACVKSGNLEREVCECAAAKAREELSPKAYAFLVATLDQDEEQIHRLRKELEMQDALAAGMFMASGPARCAEELEAK